MSWQGDEGKALGQAAGLILEIAVAADVVGVGVGVVDGCEVPVVCFEKAEYFFSASLSFPLSMRQTFSASSFTRPMRVGLWI